MLKRMATPPPFHDASDEDLAHQAADDRGAFRELHRRYHPRLFGLLRTTGLRDHDIDDVAQVVWLNVFRALGPAFQGEFRPWLFRIARNAAIDWLRKHHPALLPEDFDTTDGRLAEVGQRMQQQEETARLRDCVEKLPARQREVVQERLSGRSPEEIAQTIGVDRARIDRLFFDARANLKRCMGVNG
jgi:RNA polymerase sigma-70 factor (ECF subfamily)